MKLSEYSQGRDNNFNLIRILAALAVLVTHSFALIYGTAEAEPFRGSLGITLGTIAVDVFFITSGFLVTASLLNRQNTIEFIWARFLRIFPAMFVMLILTVFGLGLVFTSIPWQDYLSHSQTWIYFVKCATLIAGVEYNLPGIFENNPWKNAVNGSLWTMPYEVRMYSILAVFWVALGVFPRFRAKTLTWVILICSLIAGFLVIGIHFTSGQENQFVRLFFMFFTGASFFILKEHIVLSRRIFWFFLISLCFSMFSKNAFFVIYLITIAYCLFYISYIPSGIIRKYNQLGDYSYGLYIYAFPVQQSIMALFPETTVITMILFSLPIALSLAALSWHLLERKALGLKAYSISFTKKFASLW